MCGPSSETTSTDSDAFDSRPEDAAAGSEAQARRPEGREAAGGRWFRIRASRRLLAIPSVARLRTVVSRVPSGTPRLHPPRRGTGPGQDLRRRPSHFYGVGGRVAGPNRRDGPAGDWRLAASRSVTHPTRLETRTKESNMCASQWVLNRPMGAMKAKDRPARSEWGSRGEISGSTRDPSYPARRLGGV